MTVTRSSTIGAGGSITPGYKGAIACAGNPNYPAATTGDFYNVSTAGKIGGASGPNVAVGDQIWCIATTVAGNHATVGTAWDIIETNIEFSLVADHILWVDAGRTDTYTADGSIVYPFKTVLAALAVINADVGKSWTMYVQAGTYSDNLTITGPRHLKIVGLGGVVLSGTILINSGVGSYDRIEFVGVNGVRAEKGPALSINGAMTATRLDDSLIYVTFDGCFIAGAFSTTTNGTWVVSYHNCRVNGAITGTFSAFTGTPPNQSSILIESYGFNEFVGTISGITAFYNCHNSDFYCAINTVPEFENRFSHCTFASSVSIIPKVGAASVVTYVDGVSYKQLKARTPTLTGVTLSHIDGGVMLGATTDILVGGGDGTNPVWTASTGTGAPVRAGTPSLTGGLNLAGHIVDLVPINDANPKLTIGSSPAENFGLEVGYTTGSQIIESVGLAITNSSSTQDLVIYGKVPDAQTGLGYDLISASFGGNATGSYCGHGQSQNNNVAGKVNCISFGSSGAKDQFGTGIIGSIVAIPTAAGTGYAVNDVLTITGGTSGTVTVASISGGGGTGPVTGVTLTTPGHGYTTGAGKATTGGGNNACTIEISTVSSGNGLDGSLVYEYGADGGVPYDDSSTPYNGGAGGNRYILAGVGTDGVNSGATGANGTLYLGYAPVFGTAFGARATDVDVCNGKVTVGSDNGDNVTVLGNTVIDPDNQLTSSDFPNATTLYGWNMDSTTDTAATGAYAGTKFGTAKDLTIMAQKLTAANDVLGNSKYNTIIAGGYLQSTDIVFNVANTADTDDFMVGGWVYIPDATPAAWEVLFSNSGSADLDGWYVELDTNSTLKAAINLAADVSTSKYILQTIGWYHIVYTREVGVVQKLYVNGVLVGTGADDTIGTTQSKFQLGGFNGATALPEAGTRYDEFFFKKGILPTNLNDVVKGIYARSAKKFAVKDANTNVWVPELNIASGVYTPTLPSGTTNVAASTAFPISWSRIGNVVTCQLKLTCDPTAAAPTTTELYFTLPIACTTTPAVYGCALDAIYGQRAAIIAVNATTAEIYYSATNVNSTNFYGTFQYVIN